MSLLASAIIFGGAPLLGLIVGSVLAYRYATRRFLSGRDW